jgi:hypothetical protein
VTDGSKKMFKALNKAFWNYGTILSLTISKNGKYTIERASWD